MKINLLLFSLFVSVLSCSQETDDVVLFLKVRPEYKSNEKVLFELKNNTDTSFQFFVDVDAYYLNAWHPAVISDIDTAAPSRAAIIKLLPPRKTIEVIGGPLYFKAIHKNTQDDSTTTGYRFVLHYRTENNTEFKKLYSKEFIIK